ncbi:hypothetical protein F5890DRAFT_1564922 [Lentinula detonsa]|uniref:DUF6593 domain-containing protein n=1 Tax=Lentinula detonsa TaxID=2804962 RepID=A0AA38UUC7_9AGAR|nr:hypothetical protein F5890DRAFT_1564922 [Lentinula detonsa]
MEFTLSDLSPYNSTFSISTHNGTSDPMFIASTGHGLTGRKNTTIHRVGYGIDSKVLSGEIHLNIIAGDRVSVRGREMKIIDHGLAWKSIEFIASNGQVYRWKAAGTRDFNLESQQSQVIAVFSGGSKHLFSPNKQATLSIYKPEELAVEDIITTIVYVTRRRDVSKAAAAAAS